MKRISTILAAVVLCGGLALAQTAQAPAGAAGQQATRQQRMAQRQQRMQQRQQMMQQHMQEAQAKVDKLKADIEKVSDPAMKQALQDEADMWQMMLDHMKNMGQGGMMRHHGMGMQGNPPASNTNPGEPPAQNPK